jgi:hypothetical protein
MSSAVTAFNLTTGSLMWTRAISSTPFHSRVAVSDKLAMFTDSGLVWTVSLFTGGTITTRTSGVGLATEDRSGFLWTASGQDMCVSVATGSWIPPCMQPCISGGSIVALAIGPNSSICVLALLSRNRLQLSCVA